MPNRTREQKLARQIQAATGRRYTDCLALAKAQLAKETPCSTAPSTSTTDSA